MKYTQVREIFLNNKEKELIQEIRNYNDSFFIVISKFDNQSLLKEHFETIKHITAGSIQAKIKKMNFPESLKWNLYLVFLLEEEVDQELKREIQSDRFCCKKYVLKYSPKVEIEETLKNHLSVFIEFDSFISNSLFEDKNDSFLEKISPQLKKEIQKVTFEEFVNKKISLEEIINIYKTEV